LDRSLQSLSYLCWLVIQDGCHHNT
jgi:hypothetical protein